MANNQRERVDNPVPIRLRDLKAPLQRLAFDMDRSLHWLILDIIKRSDLLKDYMEQKKAQEKNSGAL